MSEDTWPLFPLKELSSRIGDGIHGTPEYVEFSEFHFVNGNNLKNGSIVITNETRMVSEEEYNKYLIEFDQNTLFMSINGTLGNLAKYNDETITLGKSAAYIKCKDIDIDFLYYYLQLQEVQKHMWNTATGSTIKNLSLGSIRNLHIPKPHEQDQKDIAAVLSTLDAKIDINNRINAELEAMAKTLYDYWFVQFDFPDENGQPYKSSGGKMVYNETLKREIPKGWEAASVQKITTLIRRGVSPRYVEKGGYCVLNQKCVRDQKVSFGPSRRHGGKVDSESERLLRIGDVLVNSTGVGTLGRVALVKRLKESMTLVDSHVTVVRNNPKVINTDYFGYSFLKIQPEIERAAEGSTGQVELSKSYLEDLRFVVPIYAIQSKFSIFVVPLLGKAANIEVENQQLIKLRDWLLPMLMNGQVTVSEQASLAQ